jgi:hypothetical protein
MQILPFSFFYQKIMSTNIIYTLKIITLLLTRKFLRFSFHGSVFDFTLSPIPDPYICDILQYTFSLFFICFYACKFNPFTGLPDRDTTQVTFTS